MYATSWWNEATVNEYLQDKRLPIWASLSAARTELYRDVQALYHGTSPFLDRCVPCRVLDCPCSPSVVPQQLVHFTH